MCFKQYYYLHKRTLRVHLQYVSPQIAGIPCHSSRGGIRDEPRGRKGLYAALSLSYNSRAPVSSSAARAADMMCAQCALRSIRQKQENTGAFEIVGFRPSPITAIILVTTTRTTKKDSYIIAEYHIIIIIAIPRYPRWRETTRESFEGSGGQRRAEEEYRRSLAGPSTRKYVGAYIMCCNAPP